MSRNVSDYGELSSFRQNRHLGGNMTPDSFINKDELLFNKLIWGIDDVCNFTAYKKGTIYNLVSSGSIPYRKRGKKLFFKPTEILEWIEGA